MEEYSFLSEKAMQSQVHILNFFLSNAPITIQKHLEAIMIVE